MTEKSIRVGEGSWGLVRGVGRNDGGGFKGLMEVIDGRDGEIIKTSMTD